MQYGFDFRCGYFFSFLGFVAVQCDVGLDEALDKIHHQVQQAIVQVVEQRLTGNPDHGFGLIEAVELFQLADFIFFFGIDISENNSLLGFLEQNLFVCYHPVV